MRLEGHREVDVVVLGAGIVGCAAALELARRNRRVAVIDPGTLGLPEAGLGHIPTGTGSPYTTVVKRRGRETARLLWESHRENHERLRALLVSLGDDCGCRQAGAFLVAADRAEAAALADSEDALRDDGFSGEFLDHYMLEARFDVTGFAGAYWAADDGEVEADRLSGALVQAAAGRGAAFYEPSAVLDVDLSGRGAEVVTARGRILAAEAVLATEAFRPGLVAFFESRLVPLESRGLTLATDPRRELPTPARMVGGEVGWRRTTGELRLAGSGDLESLARRLHGNLDPLASSRGKAAASPDGLPLIGLVPKLPLAAACGCGRLALAYAVVAAHWVAEALTSGRDPTPALFRADRPLPPAH